MGSCSGSGLSPFRGRWHVPLSGSQFPFETTMRRGSRGTPLGPDIPEGLSQGQSPWICPLNSYAEALTP